MRLAEVFARGVLAFVKIRHSIQPESVHTHIEPEIQHAHDFPRDLRIVIVEVRLMGIKAVPEVRLGDRVPGPVRGFEIAENDSRIAIFVRRVAPKVEIAQGSSWFGATGTL